MNLQGSYDASVVLGPFRMTTVTLRLVRLPLNYLDLRPPFRPHHLDPPHPHLHLPLLPLLPHLDAPHQRTHPHSYVHRAEQQELEVDEHLVRTKTKLVDPEWEVEPLEVEPRAVGRGPNVRRPGSNLRSGPTSNAVPEWEED